MIPEWIGALPPWLVLGALLGLVCSVCVAGLFVVADQLFPDPTPVADGSGEDSESRRSAEIREYLTRIEEPFTEEQAIAGETVAFYLPTRDVAITFDPRTYYRVGRTDTESVLVEHELPGLHIGTRLPFDTPSPWPEESAGVDPAAAAFDELGLPADASQDDLKSAYRKKVKEVHPDQGGSEQEFKRVRDAYATAKQHTG